MTRLNPTDFHLRPSFGTLRGAAKAGLFLYLEPLATTALAAPYLGEPFGIAAAIGGILVLGGVFVAHRAQLWRALKNVDHYKSFSSFS